MKSDCERSEMSARLRLLLENNHEQVDEAIGDISGKSCASLLGLFEGPTLRDATKYSGGGVK
jgi:hypothetical protein